MAIVENDYAAYLKTSDGEIPLRDLDAQEKIGSLSEDIGDLKKITTEPTNKNLLDWNSCLIFDGYNDGKKLVSADGFKIICIPVSSIKTNLCRVKRFGSLSSRFSVATIREEPANGVVTYNTQQDNDAETLLKGVTSDDLYVVIWFFNSNFDNENYVEYVKRIVVTDRYDIPDEYTEYEKIKEDDNIKNLSKCFQVERTQNLFNKFEPNIFYGMNTGSTLNAGQQLCVYIPVNEDSIKGYGIGRYGNKGTYFSVATIREEPANGVVTYNTQQDNDAETIQIYVYPEDKYIIVFLCGTNDLHTYGTDYYLDGLVILRRYIEPTKNIEPYRIKSTLSNKKINCFGDSFTDDPISWEYQLQDRTGCDTVHVGKGNSAIVTDVSSADSFLTRLDGISTNADITVVFGGINDARDIGNETITLGNIDSPHDTNTFYGGMQLLLDNLIDMIPKQFILGVIPPSFQPNAPYTTYLPLIQQAEREIYEKYHIPYVDLDKNCFAMSEKTNVMELYRKSITGTANYHPNKLGYSKITDCIESELLRYIL